VKASSTEPNAFAGPLYRTKVTHALDRETGDALVHPVDRVQREREALGVATFVFGDANNGSLTYQDMRHQISRVAKGPAP
jgi:hypothetical protein